MSLLQHYAEQRCCQLLVPTCTAPQRRSVGQMAEMHSPIAGVVLLMQVAACLLNVHVGTCQHLLLRDIAAELQQSLCVQMW